MSARRATVLVLVPGHSTMMFELDRRWPYALLATLLMTMLTGATARHVLDPGGPRASRALLRAGAITGHIGALHFPEPDLAEAKIFARTYDDPKPIGSALKQPEMQALVAVVPRSPERAADLLPPVAEGARGWLRLEALHLGESLRIRPFDEAGQAVPQALDAVRHLMRCRVTGEEIAIDPRLIRILTRLSEVYNRPIQLVSGHRKPYVIGTKPTSQHALGRAADIRVPGVGIEQLRSVAVQLGARGVGLYPEKGFVHVDVREKARYFWTWSEEEGEEADSRPIPKAPASVMQRLSLIDPLAAKL